LEKPEFCTLGPFPHSPTPDGQSCEAFLAMVSVCMCVFSRIFKV